MSKNRRVYDDDDGRTIADMNVEGMPWYDRERRREKRHRSTDTDSGGVELHGKDKGAAFLGILAAIAVVTVVFAVVFLLVILLFTTLGK